MINLPEPQQPGSESWDFVKELSRPVKPFFRWTRSVAEKNEADFSHGVKISKEFHDPAGRLETAYDDLEKFFAAAQISLQGKYEIFFEHAATECHEAYRIDCGANVCRIQAGDTEGIRRAIYHLEDLLSSQNGPFLPTGIVERKPWLKSRVTRCFFGPIKRPPLNRDELLDNVDYYPAEYLNRLAHEGVNGLWLTIEFRDLCKTSFSEPPPDVEKRLAKLNSTVQKCLRYGIKIYIFCIEPRSMSANEPLLQNHPELKGAKAYNGNFCFCPFSETAQTYLYEAVNGLFTRVPGLGGMINISYGERPTTCFSTNFALDCPICSQKTPGEIMAASLEPMERGMHAAAPDAELISWLYVPQNGTGFRDTGKLLDIAKKLPQNVVMQYNFESGGEKEQVGKTRHAGDYWLSYTGPSDIFSQMAATARSGNREVSAKIQVGCSHEVASVPLVPVPGLLYRKYKQMREHGISHVMQCWYFGNYPGVMNKAAGELAFENFQDSEQEFLQRLARPQWGESAEKITEIWTDFAEAYSNYPLTNMFQYYGPMHDGVVWPLYLVPADKPLAPTWKLEYGTSGDRYGECLGGFTLEDVLTLCSQLANQWQTGIRKMLTLNQDSHACAQDISLAEALNIHFQSGYNILKFYALRDKLTVTSGEQGLVILAQMREIAEQEIRNSARILTLCHSDSRLGFHPEAEGYKYFPEKLTWRINLLKSLLEEDFPQVYERLKSGQAAFEEQPTKSYLCNSGQSVKVSDFAWQADYTDGKLKIKLEDFSGVPESEFGILLEARDFYPPQRLILKKQLEIEIPLSADRNWVGFNIFRIGNPNRMYDAWVEFSPLRNRLVLGDYNPKAKGKLILA